MTIRRLYFIWDFEKQVQWLNQMAKKGLNLSGVGFARFDFKEGTPGEYVYRMEWLKRWPGEPESAAYIQFLKETGVEYVGSFKKWAYFRKKASEGAFDLFSDLDSRIGHHKRLMTMVLLLMPLLLAALALNAYEWLSYKQLPSIITSGLLTAMFVVLLAGLMKLTGSYNRLKKERILRE
jgi:uncharacterized membrane protein (DUF485 family)